MKTTFNDIKEIREGFFSKRNKASDATRAKLLKPYDRTTKNAIRLKVKNMIDDLDHIAWQFENQLDVAVIAKISKSITNQADRIIKELKALDRIL